MGLGIPSAAGGGEGGHLGSERWGRWGEQRTPCPYFEHAKLKHKQLKAGTEFASKRAGCVEDAKHFWKASPAKCQEIWPLVWDQSRSTSWGSEQVCYLEIWLEATWAVSPRQWGFSCCSWACVGNEGVVSGERRGGGLVTGLDACSKAFRHLVSASEGGNHVHLFHYFDWETTQCFFCFLLCSSRIMGLLLLWSLSTEWGWVAGVFWRS